MVFGSEAKCQGSPPCPCLSLLCPSHKEPSRSELGQHFQAFSSAGMSCRICGPPGTWTPCPVASFHSLSSMGAPDWVHAILLTSSSVQHYKAAPLRFDFPVDQPGHRSYGSEYLRWIFRYIWTFLSVFDCWSLNSETWKKVKYGTGVKKCPEANVFASTINCPNQTLL